MNIIKLNAIDSTNIFLKNLCQSDNLKNFTTVVAEHQYAGKGQMGTTWEVEEGKNLTFSTYVDFSELNIKHLFVISKAVSLAVSDTISQYFGLKNSIKWPNDILSQNKKIAGILIENIFRKGKIHSSIIGIGLNVNQKVFDSDLKHASSLSILLKKEKIDKDVLLEKIVENIEKRIQQIYNQEEEQITNDYLNLLFRYQKPSMFISNEERFMGKIVGVSEDGILQLEKEDEKLYEFELKQIKFAQFL
ncbi:biotin--[acetyl-CoA-carboxylase] ligase [Aureivirga sp. CE67]|uniref:biotin--[acetyl-CoA-carboxylase] ligase n=1 Tax=Aureivirga sp. CE67 TaxID=1788983 RepID=UPI0018CAC2E4|nr:biotin--[acetyl-CoA-carboxylase] ligase [Aureivirga sp. CE67]